MEKLIEGMTGHYMVAVVDGAKQDYLSEESIILAMANGKEFSKVFGRSDLVSIPHSNTIRTRETGLSELVGMDASNSIVLLDEVLNTVKQSKEVRNMKDKEKRISLLLDKHGQELTMLAYNVAQSMLENAKRYEAQEGLRETMKNLYFSAMKSMYKDPSKTGMILMDIVQRIEDDDPLKDKSYLVANQTHNPGVVLTWLLLNGKDINVQNYMDAKFGYGDGFYIMSNSSDNDVSVYKKNATNISLENVSNAKHYDFAMNLRRFKTDNKIK